MFVFSLYINGNIENRVAKENDSNNPSTTSTRPSIYLTHNVKVVSGEGTQSSPYVLQP